MYDVWEVGDYRDNATDVGAVDEMDAAEQVVERWEYEACEFDVASGMEDKMVMVVRSNTTVEGAQKVRVYGEPRPMYTSEII